MSASFGTRRWPGGWWRSLLSILAGNAIYYVLRDHLPERARHEAFALDLGLLVDFWICVAIYGLSLLMWPRKKE